MCDLAKPVIEQILDCRVDFIMAHGERPTGLVLGYLAAAQAHAWLSKTVMTSTDSIVGARLFGMKISIDSSAPRTIEATAEIVTTKPVSVRRYLAE